MTEQELFDLVAGLAVAQKKTDEQMAKTDTQIAELRASQEKTDEQMAKTDAQMAKTDAQMAKTDAQMAKTDATIEKMSRKIDKVAALVGNIANNQGDVAEEFFYQSLSKTPALGDLQFEIIYRNLPSQKGKLADEFDIVLTNGDSVGIIEVKQKAHPSLIDDMLERKLPNFRTLFPYYKDCKLYGAIASMVSNDALIKKSKQAGLFFLTQQGNHLILANDKVRSF